jgi:hypothetical protein
MTGPVIHLFGPFIAFVPFRILASENSLEIKAFTGIAPTTDNLGQGQFFGVCHHIGFFPTIGKRLEFCPPFGVRDFVPTKSEKSLESVNIFTVIRPQVADDEIQPLPYNGGNCGFFPYLPVFPGRLIVVVRAVINGPRPKDANLGIVRQPMANGHLDAETGGNRAIGLVHRKTPKVVTYVSSTRSKNKGATKPYHKAFQLVK